MKKNVGGKDGLARWVAGGALLLYGLKSGGVRRWLAFSAAGSLLGTAASKRCLINRLLGINSFAEESVIENGKKKPLVQETSEESFPASDAPAWAAQR